MSIKPLSHPATALSRLQSIATSSDVAIEKAGKDNVTRFLAALKSAGVKVKKSTNNNDTYDLTNWESIVQKEDSFVKNLCKVSKWKPQKGLKWPEDKMYFIEAPTGGDQGAQDSQGVITCDSKGGSTLFIMAIGNW